MIACILLLHAVSVFNWPLPASVQHLTPQKPQVNAWFEKCATHLRLCCSSSSLMKSHVFQIQGLSSNRCPIIRYVMDWPVVMETDLCLNPAGQYISRERLNGPNTDNNRWWGVFLRRLVRLSTEEEEDCWSTPRERRLYICCACTYWDVMHFKDD